MRWRLQKLLPIVLIALAVQILAPIAVCWAAAMAASDPLQSAEICHSNSGATPGQSDQGSDHRGHDGACAICCAARASASVDTPHQGALAIPYRHTVRVLWKAVAADLPPHRSGSNAQARAPPPPT